MRQAASSSSTATVSAESSEERRKREERLRRFAQADLVRKNADIDNLINSFLPYQMAQIHTTSNCHGQYYF